MSFHYYCETQIPTHVSAEPLRCLKPSWNKQDINTASHCAKPAGTGIITFPEPRKVRHLKSP